MARIHTAVALAAAMSILMLFLQLQHYFGAGLLPNRKWHSELLNVLNWSSSRLRYAESVLLSTPQDLLGKVHNDTNDTYLVGVGKADITGPIVEINFMGYADPQQTGTGLRQRLYSRAFIIGSKKAPEDRILYVVQDTQSGDTAIRHGILEGLKTFGPSYSMYGQDNVAITGTHSHSGPGAWLNYLLPQITSKGFDKQSYDAIVDGTLESIRQAQNSLTECTVHFGKTELLEANVNRSPYAYLANPAEERQTWRYDVDKELSFLKFMRVEDSKDIGMLTWFPVHGTSMLGNNTLVTGDNKGVAASLVEKRLSRQPTAATTFVAGFSQSNVGDTSPNVLGAFCEDGSGERCTFKDSLCSGRNQACHGRGPFFGLDDAGTRSCYEIGKRQAEAAVAGFLHKKTRRLSGPVRAIHAFRDFSNYTFRHPNGSLVKTCSAALGYSFAAGTTDGPGAFDFKQNSSGDANANPFWKVVRNGLHKPTDDQIACQAPKPILLDVGETMTPYQWTPNVVDIQLFRIGQLFMIVSPGEATTMAGRRWKAAVRSVAVALDDDDERLASPEVVLGGPANSYTHYIATEEEYDVQRYEGASTLYGRHTLNAYLHESKLLIAHLATHRPSLRPRPGPYPPIHVNKSLSFISPVIRDSSGFLHSFGEMVTDVKRPDEHTYLAGEVVTATFVGANPRNNLRLGGTFASIVTVNTADPAEVVRSDADWDLIFEWKRTNSVLGTSEVTISWELPHGVRPGQYYILYTGDSKSIGGTIASFEGRSGTFQVG